ncbi:MAG: PilZ domain-containing protein [Planctomycetaceae bacterium]|nr:PilZ domain-containing protein [Planctomycetaceae bacterium]
MVPPDDPNLQFADSGSWGFPRQDVYLSACLEGNQPLPAQLVEFSHRDIHFLTDRPLRYGTRIHLTVYLDLVSSVARNLAVVHWCHAGRQGWEIGAFLTHPLSERILNQSVDNLRSQLRYQCNYRGWLRCETAGRLYCVQIIDYSMSGMKVVCNDPIPEGTDFFLHVHSGGDGNPPLSGRVCWCRENSEGRYTVGCDIGQLRGFEVPRRFASPVLLHADTELEPCESNAMETLENLQAEICQLEEFLPSLPFPGKDRY